MGPGPTVTFEIVSQREDYRPGPTGAFTAGVVITFRTAGGHTGSVFVPDNQYTLDVVRAAVALRAASMDAVGALRGN
jgi:hypothetical protein